MFLRDTFRFNPQEPAGAPAVTSTPAPEAAPVAESTPVQPVSQPSGTSVSVSPGAGGTPPPAPPSWLERARAKGWQGTETDEDKILEQLIQSHQDAEKLRPLAPYATQYMQRASDFNKYLESQQQKQQQPAQGDWTQQLGWNPPPWDPAWKYQVTQDDKGNLIPVAGAPHDVVQKYQAAMQHQRDTLEKIVANPGKFMEPYIAHIATKIAQKQAQQGVGSYQEQQQIGQFVNSNPWLYDLDQSGQIKTQRVFNTQTGRYDSIRVMSQWGNLFQEKVNEYANMGLSTEHQKNLALRDVQFAFAQTPEGIAEIQKQRGGAPGAPAAAAPTPQTAREAANADFLKKQNPASSRPGANGAPAEAPINRRNLQSEMLREFKAAGVN